MPSQRLIRRQSLAQRLSSYPQDLLLSLNESYELLEWDSLSDSLSIPIGVGMNAIYLLARLDQRERIGWYNDKDVFNGHHVHDSGGWFDEASRGVHILVRICYKQAYSSCTFCRGFWWPSALQMQCIALQKEKTIAYLMRSLVYEVVLSILTLDGADNSECAKSYH